MQLFQKHNKNLNNCKKLLLAATALFFGFYAQANPQFKSLNEFGENPGELTASYFMPEDKNSALIVLLHGCTQNGQNLAKNTGLISLAKQYKFSVLIPQQSKSNNITSCFNWFSQQDSAKDAGETLSINNMINALQAEHQIAETYLIGLSAGGAMASSLLVHYPEKFTAGAVIAGIPYPCADGLIKAISCMKNGPSSQEELIDSAKASLSDSATLPKLSIWSGENDEVVSPKNSTALASQWVELAQLNIHPKKSTNNGVTKTQWLDSDNRIALQLISIADIKHGIMVNPEQKNGGVVGDYLLKSPIATMPELIKFFSLDKLPKPRQ